MANKTTNYNLTKPSLEDFYDVSVQNDNMDIIDEQLKNLNDKANADGESLKSLQKSVSGLLEEDNNTKESLEEHLTESNPHEITASKIGLGDVPNVSTNDQTPTYTESSTLTNLSSGEKISIAFGKIKKAITDLISHLADATKHITSAERTKWDAYGTSITTAQTNLNSHTSNKSNPHSVTPSQIGAAPTSHASTAKTYGVGTSTNYGHLKITDSKTSTETDTAASAKALKETYEIANSNALKLLKTQAISNISITTSHASSPFAILISGVDLSKYDCIKLVLNGTITSNCPAHHSGGVKITACNNLLQLLTTNFYVESQYGKNATGEISFDGVQITYYKQTSLSKNWSCGVSGEITTDDSSDYYSVWYTPLVDGNVVDALTGYNVRQRDNPLKLAIYATSNTFGGTLVVNGSIDVYGREV